MNKIFTLLVASFLLVMGNAQNKGHHFEIEIEGLIPADSLLLLANYYGDNQYVRDTVRVNKKGIFVIKGDTLLEGGIYMAVLIPPVKGEKSSEHFEFVVSEQEFKIKADRKDFINTIEFDKSPENEVYYDYLRFAMKNRGEEGEIRNALKTETKPKEKKKLEEQAKALNQKMQEYMENMIVEHKDKFYPKLFATTKDPEIPENPDTSDHAFPYRYYKAHFFDALDWTDGRLVRSPVFHQRLAKYFDKLVVPQQDSIIRECDFVLGNAEKSYELFKYTLAYLLNKYGNSQIMCMDAVYVHLVENYYATGKADWVDPEHLTKMKTQAANVKPTLCNKNAPNMRMEDNNGNWQELYKIDADYTLILFWDPDCGHCKKAMPYYKDYMNEIENDKSLKKTVKMFAVCTEIEMDKWKKFIKEKGIENWINVADPEFKMRPNFRDLYDINSTPKLFILDKNKKIIAKRIGAEQLADFMNRELDREPTPKENKEETPKEEHNHDHKH